MTLCYVLRQHGLEPNVDVTVIDNIQFSLWAVRLKAAWRLCDVV